METWVSGPGLEADHKRSGGADMRTEEIPALNKAFIDYATVVIGLYGASAGIPINEVLTYQNAYAGRHSKFGNVVMDPIYNNLPARNVVNTQMGYQLYLSGRIK